ncbi:MAG: VTT domain-containing protein [Dehalococcoidia bacterium]|jgi:membrane protein YqaA with SNARE-associated domain
MSEGEKRPPMPSEGNSVIAVKPNRMRRWARRHWVTITTVAVVVIISLVIYGTGGISDDISAYGYLGVFLISLIAATVLFVPIPSIPVVFLMGAILNPFLVGLMSGIGEALGEITGYTAGFSGREALDNRQRYARIKGWMRRRGTLVLFLFSSIPNLFFKLVAVSAGAIRYPFWKYMIVVFAGKTLKGTVIALLGYWTLRLFLRMFISF